jgi:hypothetical protein
MSTVELDSPYEVKATGTGVRCGNHHRDDRTYHADAASVRECYRLTAEQDADSRAEIAAELAYERHLEDRGYWEARAQEDFERNHGVIW